MQLLDLSDERLPVDYYIPTKTVTIASGATETVRLRGLNAERFGVTRILMGEQTSYTNGFGNAQHFSVTAKLVNSREVWFEGVNGQAITALFRNYSLQVPEIIPAGEEVEFTIQNHFPNERRAFIGLQGLTADQLAVREETIRSQLGFLPKKRWIYTDNEEVPANSTEPKELHKDPSAQVFGKIGLGAESNVEKISIQLIERTTTRINKIAFNMYHHLSDNFEGDPYLFVTHQKENLVAEISNDYASAALRAGVLADTLPVTVLDALGIAY